jgi:hypothetical protein
MRTLRKGDRIRIKVRLLNGWKGFGTVSEDQKSPDDLVWFAQDGEDPDDPLYGKSVVCREQCVKVRRLNHNAQS